MPSGEIPTVRRIAHLDMDAFYASVELLRRPDLKGRPVAIGGRGDPSRRGVVTTATYEARAFGIHSGMALSVAARRCPDCVFLPTDFERYRDYSRRFKRAIAEVTASIEDRGIDEVYLDLTGLPGTARALAADLQRRVADATGLSCSIGVAPNKLVAKICSDLDKPRGITIVGPADVTARIWPLPARKVPGIGPKADAKLKSLGIETVGQLAAADAGWLRGHFGERYGAWLLRAAHGQDERALDLDPEPRSRSRESTFERDLHPRRDWASIAGTLSALSARVAEDDGKWMYDGMAQRKRKDYGTRHYTERFMHSIIGGDMAAFRALSTTTSNAPVPTDLERRIIEKRQQASVIRQLATVYTIDSSRDVTVEGSLPTTAKVAEGDQNTEAWHP
jgi:DNA polymerase-4